MAKNYSDQPFQNPEACRRLLRQLENELTRPLRFMEVCGTHTAAILRSGLASLLPPALTHISGPGCPVCVTHQDEINLCLRLALEKDLILAVFGDLARVPGADGRSLKDAGADGGGLTIIYSPLDALDLAAANPSKLVVFAGIGFETTAPASAATILAARERQVPNFCLLSLHKMVMPALKTLLSDPRLNIDAFILPGHVAAVTGCAPFGFVAEEFHKPAVIAGFEPLDLASSLLIMARFCLAGRPRLFNNYTRAVSFEGNRRAMGLIKQVFRSVDSRWRGLDRIPLSGLAPREEFSQYDAMRRLGLELIPTATPAACRCGDILRGRLRPVECPAFGRACTPARPLGPCMVSSEGSCSLHYEYSQSFFTPDPHKKELS